MEYMESCHLIKYSAEQYGVDPVKYNSYFNPSFLRNEIEQRALRKNLNKLSASQRVSLISDINRQKKHQSKFINDIG